MALKKIKETQSQTEIRQREKRRRNIARCFAADPSLVTGRNIIILDDVTTTGSTMAEARRALLTAGAKKVFAIALAH